MFMTCVHIYIYITGVDMHTNIHIYYYIIDHVPRGGGAIQEWHSSAGSMGISARTEAKSLDGGRLDCLFTSLSY